MNFKAVILFVFASVIACYSQAWGQSYSEALRQRGLDRLAEKWCYQQLNRSETKPRDAAEFMAQLLQIVTDRAVRAGDADAWLVVDQLAENLLSSKEPKPEWLLVRLQRALAGRSQGELQYLIDRNQQAAQTLQKAIRGLADVAKEVEQLSTDSSRVDDHSGFTETELTSLANRVALQQATTLRLVSQCYAQDSADRSDALVRGERITRRLVALSLPPRLTWQSRIEHVSMLRSLGRLDAAKEASGRWQEQSPPAELRAAWLAEQSRLLAATGQREKALSVLQSTAGEMPEVDLALLELHINEWATAKPQTMLAERVRSGLDQILQQTQAGRYDPIWLSRAERLARPVLLPPENQQVGSGPPPANGDVDSLVRSAEFLYRSNRFADAVKAYDRAAAVAYQSGARGRAFELGTTAAAIVQQQSTAATDWRDAAARYRRVSLAASKRPDASQVHRSAVVAYSKALRLSSAGGGTAEQNAENASSWKQYLDVLEEHLTTWPVAKSVREVRWWLIDALAAREEWQRLLPQLRLVAKNDRRYERAVELLGEAWTGVLAQTPPEAIGDQLKVAVNQLQGIVIPNDGLWPERWSSAQRSAALSLARLQLRVGQPGKANRYVRRIIEAAESGKPKPSGGWQTSAVGLKAAVAVRQSNLQEAANLVAEYPPASRQDAEALLAALQPVATGATLQRRQAGQLILAVLASSQAEAAEWALPFQSTAFEATGESRAAIALLRRMAARDSGDLTIQLRLARLLARQPGEQQQREALGLLSKIESRLANSTQTTEKQLGKPWFQARLARIQLMHQLGNRGGASKLLKITRVLHPDLGGLHKEFDRMAESL